MLFKLFNLIIFSIIISSIISQQEICNYDNDCTCSICGIEDYNLTNCDFINLFCEEGTNTFSSDYKTYKNKYLNYFAKEKDSEIFCGQQKSAIKKDKQETIIIKTGKSYTTGTRVHCHYNVIYNSIFDSYKSYNPTMTYEIAEQGKNKLKFNLIILYYNTKETFTELLTDEDLRYSPYIVDATDYDEVELLLDFKENDYSHIDEIFTVKVKLELKEGKKEEGESKKDESSSKLDELMEGIGAVIGGIIIIGIVAYCCCSKEKTYEVKEKSSCSIF